MAADSSVGSGHGATGGGSVPLTPTLSVQMSEGGIDTFAASGREDVVMDLVAIWHLRVDKVRTDSVEAEARLLQANGGRPLGPAPAGTPTPKVTPFRPRSG